MTDNTTAPYHGSCLCGNVKYAVNKIENQIAHCHCTMCRKFHGAAFATFGEALIGHFTWLSGKESLKEYLASNGTKRLFCENCGSSLVFIASNDDGKSVEFSLATLDSVIPNTPDAHIYTNYSACWYQVTDGLPQYKEGRNNGKKIS